MVVQLENVGKSYFTEDLETRALRSVTLEIAHGEYVAIEGPSGCGKSTLLSILGLLDVPTSGQYLLNGRSVAHLSAEDLATLRNREIGFIFQSFNLLGELSIFENVELPLAYRGVTRKERRLRVLEALDRVGVVHRAKHYPSQLSGGEQQRVAVARALAGDPSVLLADEPTGNLDLKNGEAVMNMLQELNEAGATIVMVTHDSRFARCAKRTVGLLDGQLTNAAEAAAY